MLHKNKFINEPIDAIPSNSKNYYYLKNKKTTGFSYLAKLVLLTGHNNDAQNILEKYVKRNPDKINEPLCNGWTPLMLACVNSKTDSTYTTVKLLLKYGANPNYAVTNESALHTCVTNYENCRFSVIRLLLEYGANVNFCTSDGENALISLIKNDEISVHHRVKMVKLFLEFDVNVNYRNSEGQNAVAVICSLKNVRDCDVVILKMLFDKKINVNTRDNDGEPPISLASGYSRSDSHLDIVKLLLQFGADVNVVSDDNITPLMRACENDNVEIIRLLLNNGANVNHVGFGGYAAITYYCEHTKMLTCDVLQLLLKNGANPKILTHKQSTTLMVACINPNVQNVKLLLKNGIDVNVTNQDNRTALWFALDCNELEIINLLLEYGANANIVDVNGNSSISQIMKGKINDFDVILKILKKTKPITKISCDINELCLSNREVIIELLKRVTFINVSNYNEIFKKYKSDKEVVDLILNYTKLYVGKMNHANALQVFDKYFYDTNYVAKLLKYIDDNDLKYCFEKLGNFAKFKTFIKKIPNNQKLVYYKPGNILSLCAEYNFNNKTQVDSKLNLLFDNRVKGIYYYLNDKNLII